MAMQAYWDGSNRRFGWVEGLKTWRQLEVEGTMEGTQLPMCGWECMLLTSACSC
jgi:hypothetical protein